MPRLAIVITHPIQYYAPVFKLLTERRKIDVRVFYTWERGSEKFDEGFGKSFEWDLPLLEGYDYKFVSNGGNRGKGFRDVRNPTILQEISAWNADAVLVYGWNYLSHLRVMRHFKGRKKVLFRGDSTLLNEQQGVKKILRRIFLKWVYKSVDTAFYVGVYNKQYFLQHGLKESQLVFAPHSVDNSRFSALDAGGQLLLQELKGLTGIPEHAKKILFVGKFQWQKNPFSLLNAFIQLNNPDIHLILVGNGEFEQQLKDRAAPHSNIHFLPFQNQSAMPAVYRLGDVYCLPSVSETWGLAVNEAMACGRAILASNKLGCAPDLIMEGENGFVFESGDEKAQRESLKLIISSDLDRMGERSAQIIRDWDIDKQAIAIESVLIKN